MNFNNLSKETKLVIVRIIFISISIIGILSVLFRFKLSRVSIYDTIIRLDDRGLFWPLLLILTISFLYSILSVVVINNRRVRGEYISKTLYYSKTISSIIFIVTLYLMSNLYYTIIISLLFILALVSMSFFSIKSEEYYLNKKRKK